MSRDVTCEEPHCPEDCACNCSYRGGKDCVSREEADAAVGLVQAFYVRARSLGWRTPEMDDARALLRKWAPLEVWA